VPEQDRYQPDKDKEVDGDSCKGQSHTGSKEIQWWQTVQSETGASCLIWTKVLV